MSATIETIVICDGCGDNKGADDRYLSAKEIRESRAKEGWIQIGRKDYCTECATKFSHPQPKAEK